MTKSNKHAYLIIAHNNFEQLQLLIDLLDDARNDIYIHIDKKAKNFHQNLINAKHSDIIFVKRISVNWGGHSQIKCEMNLLFAAVKNHYQYYHLLSGIDLPLKTQNEIHDFFTINNGKNFIGISNKEIHSRSFLHRIQYYHLLQNIIGRKKGFAVSILECIENLLIKTQKLFHIHRKEIIYAYKGTNWFSINDELVQYVLSQNKIIKKQFYFSLCADEIFLQSVAMASPFSDTIVNDTLREIDWFRGNPYVYKSEDVSNLLNSSSFFARKFDLNIDETAVYKIYNHIKTKQSTDL